MLSGSPGQVSRGRAFPAEGVRLTTNRPVDEASGGSRLAHDKQDHRSRTGARALLWWPGTDRPDLVRAEEWRPVPGPRPRRSLRRSSVQALAGTSGTAWV